MKPLKTRRQFPLQVLGLAGVTAAVAAAQPKQTVSSSKHPNLAAAQESCQQAYDKCVAAQQANEWDMQGHAQKAKNLLEQANTQLKAAAQAANAANKKKAQ
jgi:recombinational DNA repair protein (RecF pathway)